jgi:hypothetical protein
MNINLMIFSHLYVHDVVIQLVVELVEIEILG